MAIVHSVIYDAVPSPKIYNPDVPAWLENVVMKLLSKDPANRFASGKELFQALDYRPVATGGGVQASGGSGEIRKQPAYIAPPGTKPQPGKGSSQRVALYSLLGVAFVALLVVGYLLWSGDSGGGGGIDNGSAKQQAGTEKLQENLSGNNQESEKIARQKEVAEKRRLAKKEESKRKTQSGSGKFTDSRDGQTYPIVKIGNQIWMAKNLNFATTSGSWCYDNQSSNCDIYGRLYDWNTANKVCPVGWHLPSDEEWKTLEKYLGMSETDANTEGFRNSGYVGGKLKETGNSHWNSPNTGANNSSGFAALPGGTIGSGGFYGLGYLANFWSASGGDASHAWRRVLDYSLDGVYRYGYFLGYSFSVRCLQND